MAQSILELRGVTCEVAPGQPLFENVSFVVNEGDIVVLQGKSGSGKTTLLKCIAHLVLHKGNILYRGRTPRVYGIPTFRTRVLYVPQRPSLLPGTPKDFLFSISKLKSHRAYKDHKPEKAAPHKVLKRAVEVSGLWGVEEELWEREWSNLSGGEAQRIALAVALALDTAEVLLLDEPTSALDPQSSSMVEEFLAAEVKSPERELKALIWITHSDEQAKRVGTRFLNFLDGGCAEETSSV
ncbi:P-loop containing nucleoside triphosphate hydrolase protein [Macrolepiota fuliginosa MF-IS2]|uniref:P-loop containing nucleoside triphosphate hydrolase protein n=1 Tax=Macrolepiota fuliginosa MF-IS2 TaxID=1400762 RepID=A0A9P5XPF4_9AGAR|nr:P-loop containing nucleoside triphosphate hydrolase protein [Macrolepiota fuliginosa MF-IS2]